MKAHGWLGLVLIAASETALFTGLGFVRVYFTPLVWTGYILLLDALVFARKGSSPLVDRPGEFFLMAALSIACWYVFEAYNLLTRSWAYVGLPDSWISRHLGYFWSFATIFPGLFLTAELLETLPPFRRMGGAPREISTRAARALVTAGAVCLLVPLLFPSPYVIPFVWVGFVLLLDPVNHKLGAKSIFSGPASSGHRRAMALLTAGLICGFLWEFWNFWAEAKWEYNVPYLSEVKIFEMPVLGFLGFPPFALECYAMYHFTRTLLPVGPASARGAQY